MSTDFNLSLGKKSREGQISQNTFTGGIKQEQIKNQKLLNIFNAIDDGDGVLDQTEMDKLKEIILKAAGDDNLSKKEAAKILKNNNITNATAEDFFEFLNELDQANSNIESSIVKSNGDQKTVVITYKDGSTETINPDKSKEIVSKNGKKTVKDSNNRTMYTEESDEEGNTLRTEYEGGVIKKTVKTGKGGSPVTTTFYDENGQPEKLEKQNGITLEEYMFEEGSEEPKLVKRLENKGLPAKEKLTEYSYDGDNVTETVISNGATSVIVKNSKSGEIITSEIFKDGYVTSRTRTENGFEEVITDIANQENSTVNIYDNDTNKLSSTIRKYGETYKVEYDGKGNTKIIIQNGEPLASIAEKFGCTVEELRAANGGQIKGWAGEEIVVPGELAADDARLQGRQTAQEAEAAYHAATVEIEQVKQEVADRKPITWTEQNYNTFEEIAARLFKREGVENPTRRQMEARIEDLKKTNPELKNGELKGKKIIANVAQEMHNRFQARETAAEAYNQNVETRKQSETLAKEFYSIADKNSSYKSLNKMQEFLDKNIDSKNIIAFLDAYDNEDVRKGDSSIIDTITSEILPSGDKEIQKKVLRTVMDKLKDAALEAGVSEADVNKAVEDFEASIAREYDSMSGAFRRTNPKDMEKAIDFLRGAIAAKQTKNVEDISDKEAIDKFNEDFKARDAEAQHMFSDAREEEGWVAAAGDWVCGLFGCNTVEDLEAKLGDNADAVKKLASAKTEEEFKTLYKEVFGIDFDKEKIAAREAALGNYMQAQGLNSTIMITDGILKRADSLSFEDIKNEIRAKFELDEETVNEIIESYSSILDLPAESDDDKRNLLLNFLRETKSNSVEAYQNLTEGKTLEQMEKDLELLNKSAFGTNDIVKDVIQFNENMVMTEMITESALEIAGTIALQFVPGLGQAAMARLAVSGAKFGTKAVKIANAAEKGFAAAKNVNTGKAVSEGVTGAKYINRAGQIGSQMVNAGVATTGVGISNGDEAKEVMRKTLMNMSFAGVGASSSVLAPKLMKAFGITDKALANEIAEEIINAAGSYGITEIAGGEYGSTDAFVDFATGLVISRVSHVKTTKTDAGTPAAKPEAESTVPKKEAEKPSTSPETEVLASESEVPPTPLNQERSVQAKNGSSVDSPANKESVGAEIKPDAEVEGLKRSSDEVIQSISDSEIPDAHKNLWTDIKQQYNEVSSMLSTAITTGGTEFLAKCKTLSANLKTMLASATGELKLKLDQLINNVQKMMDKISDAVKTTGKNNGFKPVTTVQEAEKLYDQLVTKRFIGDASPKDGEPVFWSPNGWAQTMYKNDHSQGTPWKIHLYADSPQEWANVAQLAMPYLNKNEISYKTVVDLDEHFQILRETVNSEGVHSQTGKAFTIYFESEEQFLKVAQDLDKIFSSSGLTSSGTVMHEAQIGESGFISYRHEGAERGTQYKPDDIEDPYLKMKNAESVDSAADNPSQSVQDTQFTGENNINDKLSSADIAVSDINKNYIARLKEVNPGLNDESINILAAEIAQKPEIADKLMELATTANLSNLTLSELVNMADKNNIDDILKLSQNSNLRFHYADGQIIRNDFETVLKMMDVYPEFRTQLLDIASKSGRTQLDVYSFLELMKKYPDNADDIAKLAISNKNILVGYDKNNNPLRDIDNIMEQIKLHPDYKDEILDYMSVQRKHTNDTSDPTELLWMHVDNLRKFPGQHDVIMTLSKNPNLNAESIGNLLSEYAQDSAKIQDIVNLSAKKYDGDTIKQMLARFEENPQLRDIYLSDSPEFTLIDKTPDKTSESVIERRFEVRARLEAMVPDELEALRRTLGDDFFNKVKWEDIIPENATDAQIKEILSTLNEESKFFARTSGNERQYGKNIQWAHEMNNISDAAEMRILSGASYQEVINNIAADYKSYDIATTLENNNAQTDRRIDSGRSRISEGGWGSAITPLDDYPEYKERFEAMANIKRTYNGINLTTIGPCNGELCMIHPRSSNIPSANAQISKCYDNLQPLVQKVQNGGKLSNAELKFVDEQMAEMYYLLANVMPWNRGSNGISDIFMRSMYKSLGIEQPALRQGVSLDLESFCMSMDEYKAKWNTFFEEPV